MSFFKKLFGKKDPFAKQERDAARYAVETAIAQSGAFDARMKLAKSPKTHQEILYYLAEHDMDAAIRRAVAENIQTPLHANPVIVKDKDQDVRLALAERLVKLLPDLSPEKHSQLYAYTIDALGTLALDEVLKIRTVLSSTLKDTLAAPPKVVGQLARDIERQVSEPILRYCTAVSDDDLLDILKGHPAGWIIEAIAARKNVSGRVSDAVIDAHEERAGVVLLENETADIPMATLSKIVEKAKSFTSWQRPIATRKFLPPEIAKKLATFVDQSVRQLLLERTDLDADTMTEISNTVRRRLDMMDENEKDQDDPTARVKKMIAENRLNEDAIVDAMGVRDREFVIVGLAAMVHTTKSEIEKIIAMKAPKPILAICWKGKLSMRTAFQLQKELAMIPPKELIYPRGGTDYPLEAKELEWQLEFLGLKK
jgi:hypothetical protein